MNKYSLESRKRGSHVIVRRCTNANHHHRFVISSQEENDYLAVRKK